LGISENTIVDCHLLYVTKRTDNELFMVLPEVKGSQSVRFGLAFEGH
jgi:hypothetical protein